MFNNSKPLSSDFCDIRYVLYIYVYVHKVILGPIWKQSFDTKSRLYGCCRVIANLSDTCTVKSDNFFRRHPQLNLNTVEYFCFLEVPQKVT
jgi:hypothetical protein